jgi:hypothetical protein
MKIEIRADSVLIDGYVNAVERDSKVLRMDRLWKKSKRELSNVHWIGRNGQGTT